VFTLGKVVMKVMAEMRARQTDGHLLFASLDRQSVQARSMRAARMMSRPLFATLIPSVAGPSF
jgi:hypothetical protein